MTLVGESSFMYCMILKLCFYQSSPLETSLHCPQRLTHSRYSIFVELVNLNVVLLLGEILTED